jgi:hypothetical protein
MAYVTVNTKYVNAVAPTSPHPVESGCGFAVVYEVTNVTVSPMIRGRARVMTLEMRNGKSGAASRPANADRQARNNGCFVLPSLNLAAWLSQCGASASQVANEWRSSSMAPKSSMPRGLRYPRHNKGMTHVTKYRENKPAVLSGGSFEPSI